MHISQCSKRGHASCLGLVALGASLSMAQPGGRDRFQPGGPPGGFGSDDIELVETHDHDENGWLDQEERAEARKALATRRVGQQRGRGFRGGDRGTPAAGPTIEPGDVSHHGDADLYDDSILRTIFFTFENEDWEQELEDFHGTDVEVPAIMSIDGRTYPGVGMRFRGASSYMMVPTGFKRSFNVSIDLVDEDQRLQGFKTLNLLNCNGDASMMSTVLYSKLASPHLAVPKANFVRVVVNGEYRGVFVNVQQFDKIFTEEHFGSSKGTRWKVPGSPRGDGGLAYDGEDLSPYKARYDMKSNDGDDEWNALVELCRVLDETPRDQLIERLEPILDIDETLWFLAFDVALVNSDGYWTRASDYCLFRDRDGRFHVIPHDMNEAFSSGRGGGRGGPGRPGANRPSSGGDRGPGGRRGGHAEGGTSLDPLVGIDNERLALRHRLLAVPELRARYLDHIREIAESDLDWNSLGPEVARYRALIEDAARLETRSLISYDAFDEATKNDGGSLRDFAEQRRAFLLNHDL